jgi:hypothetical protein
MSELMSTRIIGNLHGVRGLFAATANTSIRSKAKCLVLPPEIRPMILQATAANIASRGVDLASASRASSCLAACIVSLHLFTLTPTTSPSFKGAHTASAHHEWHLQASSRFRWWQGGRLAAGQAHEVHLFCTSKACSQLMIFWQDRRLQRYREGSRRPRRNAIHYPPRCYLHQIQVLQGSLLRRVVRAA